MNTNNTNIHNALAGIAVSQLEDAIAWYAKVIGRSPDQRPMPEVAEYKFRDGGWLQLFVDPSRAGHSSVTLVVGDLAEITQRLASMSVIVLSQSRSPSIDTVIVTDLDGNQVVFAQHKHVPA